MKTTSLHGESLCPCECCHVWTKGNRSIRSNHKRDFWAWWLKHPSELQILWFTSLWMPGLADLHSLAGPRGMTFVIGGRRVGGNLSDFLHYKKFQPKLYKESCSTFFSEFPGVLWKVSISPNVLLISPYARMFKRLCFKSVLQHCFIITSN